MAIISITPDVIAASQNERFNVVARTRNISSDTFPGGQMGVALVDNNDNSQIIIGSVSFNPLDSGNTWTRTISNCSVPNSVDPGHYQLMIVVRPTGGDWRLATMSENNAPTSIDFEVQ